MLEVVSYRKNKITLSDYEYLKDIENRVVMSQFSTLELEVLEEILYSPLTFSPRDLANNLNIELKKLFPILQILSHTKLFTLSDELITVDKEMRKYYEFYMVKFEEDFKPGMEFIQGLLKKVPLSSFLSWYNIPRTSNNIFDSLIEKYFYTPQIFQRYLEELHFQEEILNQIIHDVYSSPNLEVAANVIIEKYDLTRPQFEEILLQLEFNFACFSSYKKKGQSYLHIVTPFHEWKEYLLFLKNSEAKPVANPKSIILEKPTDFGFIECLASVLQLSKKSHFLVKKSGHKYLTIDKSTISSLSGIYPGFAERDADKVLHKLLLLKFADLKNGQLVPSETGLEWLKLSLENRALSLYRHPVLTKEELPTELCSEKTIREAEKSILRVLNSGWIYLEDFLKGAIVPLNENQIVSLKRIGKHWQYLLPKYSEEDIL
ncbi:MAG: hypothetical protein L0207_02400, partial [Chlamydiae bacterium]|nr:hypothetical protein [Chlamydiota bacterium]